MLFGVWALSFKSLEKIILMDDVYAFHVSGAPYRASNLMEAR